MIFDQLLDLLGVWEYYSLWWRTLHVSIWTMRSELSIKCVWNDVRQTLLNVCSFDALTSHMFDFVCQMMHADQLQSPLSWIFSFDSWQFQGRCLQFRTSVPRQVQNWHLDELYGEKERAGQKQIIGNNASAVQWFRGRQNLDLSLLIWVCAIIHILESYISSSLGLWTWPTRSLVFTAGSLVSLHNNIRLMVKCDADCWTDGQKDGHYLTVWSESHPASHWWYPSS